VQSRIVGQGGAQQPLAVQDREFGMARKEVLALLLRDARQSSQVGLGDELMRSCRVHLTNIA